MTDPSGYPKQGGADGWLVIFLVWPFGMGGLIYLLHEAWIITAPFFQLQTGSPDDFALDIMVPVTLILNIFFVRFLYRQKHTYAPLKFPKNILLAPLLLLWFAFTFLLFFGTMLMLVGLVTAFPAILVYRLLVWIHHSTNQGDILVRVFSGIICVVSVPACMAALSSVSRLIWIFGVSLQVKNLATSTVRGAATGLVELHGLVSHAASKNPECPIIGFSPLYETQWVMHTEPFYLDDGTGRVAVIPPLDRDTMNPRYVLNPHPVHGQRVLMEGEEVHLIGELKQSDNPISVSSLHPGQCVEPWIPPYGRFYVRLASFTGKFRRYFLFLAPPDLFLVAAGKERSALGKLLTIQIAWVLVSLILGSGALAVFAVSIHGIF